MSLASRFTFFATYISRSTLAKYVASLGSILEHPCKHVYFRMPAAWFTSAPYCANILNMALPKAAMAQCIGVKPSTGSSVVGQSILPMPLNRKFHNHLKAQPFYIIKNFKSISFRVGVYRLGDILSAANFGQKSQQQLTKPMISLEVGRLLSEGATIEAGDFHLH